MAIDTEWSAWSSDAVFGQRDQGLPDAKIGVQTASATGDWASCEPAQARKAGLAGAGLHDVMPASEDVDGLA